jgi:hypothetical protein
MYMSSDQEPDMTFEYTSTYPIRQARITAPHPVGAVINAAMQIYGEVVERAATEGAHTRNGNIYAKSTFLA